MNASVNRITLMGRLGRDPELRQTREGRPVASLSLATLERWTARDGGRRERTEWHRVVILNEGQAQAAGRHLRKGGRVLVEGRLQTRKWQDREGRERVSAEIVLSGPRATLTLLDARPEEGEGEDGECGKEGETREAREAG